MSTKPTLTFKPIDLDLYAELTVMFRIDAFICSFGNAEKFGKKNSPQAKLYIEWLQKRLSDDPMSVVHVWLRDSMIGQVELSEDKLDPTAGYVNLYYLIPEMRGLGLADQLDQYAMNYFLEQGYQKARLSISKSNIRAIKFYKRLGWRIMGDNPDDLELSLMEKTI